MLLLLLLLCYLFVTKDVYIHIIDAMLYIDILLRIIDNDRKRIKLLTLCNMYVAILTY